MIQGVTRPYKIESTTWGQSIQFADGGNNLLMITACDFDSGQTCTVGINMDQVKAIVEVLHLIEADVETRATQIAETDSQEKEAIKAKAKARRERDGK